MKVELIFLAFYAAMYSFIEVKKVVFLVFYAALEKSLKFAKNKVFIYHFIYKYFSETEE
jgi:hypothetical protein